MENLYYNDYVKGFVPITKENIFELNISELGSGTPR